MAQATPSIIAHGVVINGDMTTEGEVQLDGAVTGDLTCKNLTMGETGSITGNIIADEAIIRGNVNGEVHARTVRLEKSAVLNGDVFHFSLAVESGAVITGQFRHSETVTGPEKKLSPQPETPALTSSYRDDAGYTPKSGSAYSDDDADGETPQFLSGQQTSAAE